MTTGRRTDSTTPIPGLRRAVIASVLGNGLEWFDFLSYAYFASSIGRAFFPLGDPVASLLLTYGVFAMGFVVRPVGGVLFGLYADHKGRKRALTLLTGLMAAGTLLMGLTPPYERIGLAAPVIVILARLIQGVSVGGEFGSAAAMLVEYAPPRHRMFYASFQMMSHGVALIVVSVFGYALTTRLAPAALDQWGWRIPFFFGALVGPVGLYIRHYVGESPEFLRLQTQRRNQASRTVRPSVGGVICGIGVISLGAAVNYLWHSYAPTYVVQQLHLPLSAALGGAAVAGLVASATYPLAGWIADRIGPFRLLFPLVAIFALSAWPLYHYVASAPSVERLLVGQIVAALFLGLMSGAHPGMLAALFPTESRSTGIALSYNIAVAVFGGLAPMIVTGLIALSGDEMMPAYYQMVVAAISLVLIGLTASAWRGIGPSAADPARSSLSLEPSDGTAPPPLLRDRGRGAAYHPGRHPAGYGAAAPQQTDPGA